MAKKHGGWLLILAGVLLLGGCSSGDRTATCAADSGAEACVVHESGQTHIEVTGFEPASDVTITRSGPANPRLGEPDVGTQPAESDPGAPMTFRVAADGTNGGGTLGLVGLVGPVTFTLSGTADTGAPVALSLAVD